jgi:hypothetical protein
VVDSVTLPALVLLGFVAAGIVIAGAIRWHGTRYAYPDHYIGGIMVLTGLALAGIIFIGGTAGGL